MNKTILPSTPYLIAHRGDTTKYPENTFCAIEAAVNCGARFVEIDIQFTLDGVAVVFHDESLLRMTGHDSLITETTSDALKQYPILNENFPAIKNEHIAIPHLQDVIQYLKHINDVILFVEIKEESLEKFGINWIVDKLLKTIDPLKNRAVLISYNHSALSYSRQNNQQSLGWVIKEYTELSQQIAMQLKPDYLFCNHQKIKSSALWPGDWKWALYEITDPELAIELASTGIELIETMEISNMFKHTLLAKQCYDHDKKL